MQVYDAAAAGRRLRRLRKSKGLTQKALGERVGVSDRHISTVENGRENPGFETLIRLCDVLNVTPDYLILGSRRGDRCDEIADRLRLCGSAQQVLVKTVIEVMLRAPAWPEEGMMQIETREGCKCFNKREIIYVEALQKRVLLHLRDRSYETQQTMSYWDSVLGDAQFFRTHRSYIVNLYYVSGYDHQMVRFLDGTRQAYLARRKYGDFHRAYTRWLEKKRSDP